MDTGLAEGKVTGPRIGRTGLLVAAVIVSALALTVSLMPFDGAGGGGSADARGDSADRQPVADPGVSSPSATTRPAGTLVSPEPSESANGSETKPDPEPQGTSTSPAHETDDSAGPTHSASSSCEVTYEIVNQWPDGFQASVTVTSVKALDGWSVAWTFHDGQRVSQMWDGTFVQNDSRVTATAADYNKSVAAAWILRRRVPRLLARRELGSEELHAERRELYERGLSALS